MSSFTESKVEEAALAWLESTGWSVRNGAAIAPGEPGAECDDYGQVVLAQRLLVMLELGNTANEDATTGSAFQQVQAYKAEFEFQEAWK